METTEDIGQVVAVRSENEKLKTFSHGSSLFDNLMNVSRATPNAGTTIESESSSEEDEIITVKRRNIWTNLIVVVMRQHYLSKTSHSAYTI